MARHGTVYLIGDGRRTMNPISGRDLAAVCVDASLSTATDVEVGGPDVFSHEEIARAAFTAARTAPRIRHIPRALAVTLWCASRTALPSTSTARSSSWSP